MKKYSTERSIKMSYLEENLKTKIPLKCNADGKFKILLFGDIHEHIDYKTNPKFKEF